MQLSMVTRREVMQLSMAVLQHGACCVCFSKCVVSHSDPGHCFGLSLVVSGVDRMEASRRGDQCCCLLAPGPEELVSCQAQSQGFVFIRAQSQHRRLGSR